MLAGIHAMLENFLVDLHSGHCNLLLIRIIITVFNNCFLPTCRAYKICILPDKAILCREQERGPCLNPKFLDIPTMRTLHCTYPLLSVEESTYFVQWR